MKNWGRKLLYYLGAILCSALLIIQSAQLVWADDGDLSGTTSDSTDVTVTFTQANLYIERMPNLDFGTKHSLLSSANSTGVELNYGSSKEPRLERSLIVNSPDAAVGFSVSVSCGNGYLHDPDTNDNTFPQPSQSMGTLTINPDSSKVKIGTIASGSESDPSSWLSLTDSYSIGSSPIQLYVGNNNSSTSTNVLSFTNGIKGQIGLNFYDSQSVLFKLTDDELNALKDYFATSSSNGSGKHQHLNLIFPLQWTASITPETSV